VIDRGTVNLSGNQAGATGGYALNIVNSATSTLNLGSATQTAATTAVTAISKAVQLGAIPGVNTAVSTSAQTLNVNGAAGFPTTVANHGIAGRGAQRHSQSRQPCVLDPGRTDEHPGQRRLRRHAQHRHRGRQQRFDDLHRIHPSASPKPPAPAASAP
jgi:hypothetical protein